MNAQDPIKSKRVPRFVDEYVKDSNGTKAALAAGWPASWAHVAASRLLKEPNVQALIAERRAEIARNVEVDVEFVLREWMALAAADPSKISQVRRINCRHCWGSGFEYRWKAHEYAKACDDAANHRTPKGVPDPLPLPSCAGGFGFRRIDEPNPECPRCDGEGEEDILFSNMDTLGPAERKLIASVERTKDGLKVKMRDQDGAINNLAKYLGMLIEKRELTGKNGAPLGAVAVPAELPAEAAALAAMYSQIVSG